MKKLLLSIMLGLAAAMLSFPLGATESLTFSDTYCGSLAATTSIAAQQATHKIAYSEVKRSTISYLTEEVGAPVEVVKAGVSLTRRAYKLAFGKNMAEFGGLMGMAYEVYNACMATEKPGVVTYDLPPDWNSDPVLTRSPRGATPSEAL